MPPLDLPRTFLGRPIAPFAFAILLSVVATAYQQLFTDADTMGTTVFASIVGWLAVVASFSLIAAWVACSRMLLEIGLVVSFGVWLFRVCVYLFEVHPVGERNMLATCTLIVCGATFWFERSPYFPVTIRR